MLRRSTAKTTTDSIPNDIIKGMAGGIGIRERRLQRFHHVIVGHVTGPHAFGHETVCRIHLEGEQKKVDGLCEG